MNSIIFHKYERYLNYSIYTTFSFIILSLLFSNGLFELLSVIGMAFVFLQIIYIFKKTNRWKKEGFQLSRSIGLESIIIMASTIDGIGEVYELHHNPGQFKDGILKMKYTRKDVIEKLRSKMKNDFIILADWLEKNEQRPILTTTHPSLLFLWKKTSQPSFSSRSLNRMVDPYIKMFTLNWMFATFRTTGRISFRSPKKWETFIFEKTER